MTDFLYPFIEGGERDVDGLLAALVTSAQAKREESRSLGVLTLERDGDELDRAAAAMAARFDAGGRLFTFGNGGSSTDAAGLAALFSRPPWGIPLPARCLVEDTAVLTALGNDVGFELVFSRQLIAHAAVGDVAVAFSTSGGSRNVLAALAEARSRGLLTIGLAGYDGGDMAASADVQHCLVVRSDSVHRIQEAQAALGFALWAAVQQRLEGEVRNG
jgi:D-sedoheptulose 7-phosphate isomerase